MTLYIKNMVCNRCKEAVKSLFVKSGLSVSRIELGEVEVGDNDLPPHTLSKLSDDLRILGFEMIDDRKGRIIEKIKNVVVNIIHHSDDQPREKYSELIAAQLHYDYSYLSKLFSEVEGVTIEHYIIHQKIEKIKEYIVYDELTLNEISYRMGYSSVAHLSNQFKKVTGMTPSYFKTLRNKNRLPLDEV
ncbi:MAG: helix-turn-helix transcriptional regulator [Chitinophagaceae bacterium]|nr:helix-turn-helix transcriptional regulator [Chitinophagaceae bacterium]